MLTKLQRAATPLAIAQTLTWAKLYYSFPALLTSWQQALGWSKSELSGAFTAALIVSAFAAPLIGNAAVQPAAHDLVPLPELSEDGIDEDFRLRRRLAALGGTTAVQQKSSGTKKQKMRKNRHSKSCRRVVTEPDPERSRRG